MSGAHSAPWGGKSRARHGAAQVVIGITVAAGKVWAAKPENVLDLGGRGALRKELPGDPQIQDAPVRLRKTLCNVPALHPGLVGLRRLCSIHTWGRGCIGCSQIGSSEPIRRRPCWRRRSRLQQPIGAASQPSTGVHDLHPGSVAAECAPLGLLIGESRQPAQMTPVGTAHVPTIGAGQLLAGRRRHRGFQRGGAEVNPGLEMSRAGLEHHTRIMSIGPHALDDRRVGAVEINQDVARIAVLGVRAGGTRHIPRGCERART